jgi:hypothetical protein
MGNEQGQIETAVVVKEARPFTGFFLGLLFGVALAVILQQAGVWPLDRLLLFGAAGIFSLIGILIAGAGRAKVGPFSSILPLLLSVGLIGVGATGLTTLSEMGELNGGCTVQATSSLDETVVTDTSRQDPFVVDPEGSLSWVATSPGPITDHLWNIYVDVGGFSVRIAGNDEPEPNTDGDQENVGDVADVSAYVREVSDFTGVELRGVFEVAGDIEGGGGACDGFGFVRLEADPLTTIISQIAAGVALLALIGLGAIAFNRTREAEVVVDEEMLDAHPYAEVPAASAGAAAVEPEADAGAPGVEPEADAGPPGVEPEEDLGPEPATGAHERPDERPDDVPDDDPGPNPRDDM